jgi:hypothetical protein
MAAAAAASPPRPAPNGLTHPDELISTSGGKTHVEERNTIPRTRKTKSPMRAKKTVEDDSLLRSLCALICDNQVGTRFPTQAAHVDVY